MLLYQFFCSLCIFPPVFSASCSCFTPIFLDMTLLNFIILLCHLELRSRVWLGNFNRVDDDSVLSLWCINSIANSKLLRYTKAPNSVAKGTIYPLQIYSIYISIHLEDILIRHDKRVLRHQTLMKSIFYMRI